MNALSCSVSLLSEVCSDCLEVEISALAGDMVRCGRGLVRSETDLAFGDGVEGWPVAERNSSGLDGASSCSFTLRLNLNIRQVTWCLLAGRQTLDTLPFVAE